MTQIEGLVAIDVFEEVKKQLNLLDDLKEEIEDLQEEIDDLECKAEQERKRKQGEQIEFQDTISLLQEQINNGATIKDQLHKEQAELTEANHQLQLAMDFVSTILSAPDIEVRMSSELLNIYDMYQYLKDDVLGVLNIPEVKMKVEKCEHAFTPSMEDIERWRLLNCKYWLIGKKKVAFVGEFSAGKTSIVNRILSHDDKNRPLLPVSTEATTAIPTYITGFTTSRSSADESDGFKYKVYTPDNKIKELSEQSFKAVDKSLLERIKGANSLIKYFVMEYNNEYLKGLSILDTPGFSSNDEEDTIRTVEVINECDALFWVFDVNTGTVNQSSINILKKFLKKPLYIVINKVDTKSKGEVDQVEQLIRATLENNGLPFKEIIRFAHKNIPLEVIMEPIWSLEKDTSESYLIEGIVLGLKKVKSAFLEDEKELQHQQNKNAGKVSNLMTQYSTAIKNVSKCFSDLVETPSMRSSFFGGVKYEMDEESYEQFTRLPKTGQDTLKKLHGIVEELVNIHGEWNALTKERNKTTRTRITIEKVIEGLEQRKRKLKHG